ncbi:MAG: S-methyl-5'-thioinosine phosphorylase [Candidatus Uhrbacteria bacterium]
MRSFGLSSTDHLLGAEPPFIGIIGGSGMELFSELRVERRVPVETPFGQPSGEVLIAEYGGSRLAFLARHGEEHELPPHKVPYKANLAALKAVGVRTVIGTCIAGSLRQEIEPGHFAVPDQFVNLTWGRDDTGAKGDFIHLGMADPYCESVRSTLIAAAQTTGARVHSRGTVAVIQGPRFSTKAESRWLMANGWDLVNMTQYPECYFARELGLCYAAFAAITDWDVGISSALSMNIESMESVLPIFRSGITTTKLVLEEVLKRVDTLHCSCASERITEYYKRA